MKVRSDITCNFCLKPITDHREGHILWRSKERGSEIILVAHSKCDKQESWAHYSWQHLHLFLGPQQEEMRRHFNVQIWDKVFSRQDVEEGLKQIFEKIPDDYFEFTEEDYRLYHET